MTFHCMILSGHTLNILDSHPLPCVLLQDTVYFISAKPMAAHHTVSTLLFKRQADEWAAKQLSSLQLRMFDSKLPILQLRTFDSQLQWYLFYSSECLTVNYLFYSSECLTVNYLFYSSEHLTVNCNGTYSTAQNV